MKSIWRISFEITLGILILVIGYDLFKEISETSITFGLFFLFSVVMIVVLGLCVAMINSLEEREERRITEGNETA